MAKARKKIGLTDIRSLKSGEMIWDSAVGGFHARRQKSSSVSYVVVYRTTDGRQRWQTIGRHGSPWTPDTAREAAKRILGRVVDGADPAAEKQSKRKAASVAELCDLYLADAEAGRLLTRRKSAKKATTITTDRGRIERHIKPLLGNFKVAAVTREDVDGFMHAVADGQTAARVKTKKHGLANVRGGKGTATRTVGLLGAIFSYAVRHRMRPDNPVRGIVRFADGRRERRLSNAEYKFVGATLIKLEGEYHWPPKIVVARFLLLTGWRSGEVLGLRWSELDLPRRTATLGDTKTGRSVRPLSKAAVDVLLSLDPVGQDDALVFPAARGNSRMSGFPKFWGKLCARAEISASVTPHTLRHSFASIAGDLGYSETTIAALLGHRGQSITSRYVHAADEVLLAAADAVAQRTTELLCGVSTPKAEIVQLRSVA